MGYTYTWCRYADMFLFLPEHTFMHWTASCVNEALCLSDGFRWKCFLRGKDVNIDRSVITKILGNLMFAQGFSHVAFQYHAQITYQYEYFHNLTQTSNNLDSINTQEVMHCTALLWWLFNIFAPVLPRTLSSLNLCPLIFSDCSLIILHLIAIRSRTDCTFN